MENFQPLTLFFSKAEHKTVMPASSSELSDTCLPACSPQHGAYSLLLGAPAVHQLIPEGPGSRAQPSERLGCAVSGHHSCRV